MVMNPKTHPRGMRPDFTLPRPNPNPGRMTDALWWLVCMRKALEPSVSENGGTYADKPGYHNAGNNLPDRGEGNSRTDHSIRRAPDRRGSWWRTKASAHDWTFLDAQHGEYATIQKYTRRLVNAMRDPKDLRPDNVYAYTLGQVDGDVVVEGYNEYRDDAETSGDKTHLWHRHDSFRRDVIGNFWSMWKALTIDMGWTYDEWLASTASVDVPAKDWSDMATKDDFKAAIREVLAEKTPYGGKVGERIAAAGWGETSILGRLDYLTELVMAKESVPARLENIKQELVSIREALAAEEPPAAE
jgi:hypothetical protein